MLERPRRGHREAATSLLSISKSITGSRGDILDEKQGQEYDTAALRGSLSDAFSDCGMATMCTTGRGVGPDFGGASRRSPVVFSQAQPHR